MTAINVAPPNPRAYAGLAGALVEAVDPHTEADPAAVQLQTLVLFGCAVGVRPFFRVGAEEHR